MDIMQVKEEAQSKFASIAFSWAFTDTVDWPAVISGTVS
jgi:hypothetical protein